MKSTTNNSNSRRQFISKSLKAGAFTSLFTSPIIAAGNSLFEQDAPTVLKSNKSLKILILGGTSFLGPHQIKYALDRGHSISIFTRGKTIPTVHQELLKNVEHLIGDREDNLDALKGKKWDAVIDNSGRRVQWTKDTAALLKDNVELYLYTSSTGVFYPYLTSNIKEDSKLILKVPEGLDETQKMEYDYGVMKANSEIEVTNEFGKNRSIIVRPTYMVGPGDRMDRFNYWPVRMERGGEIMVPGKKEDPVQFIDVRDVGKFMIQLIENKITGTFNTAGPASETHMERFIHGAHAAFGNKASFIWIDDYDFLKEHNIHYIIPWIMPEGDNYGSARVNIENALNNGLTYTPLSNTIQDIMKWWNSTAVSEQRRKELIGGEKSIMAKESLLLKAWKDK